MIKKDPIKYAKSIGVNIGDNCRLLGIKPSTFGSEPYLIHIGNHVTITSGVRFITHDGGVWVFREENPDIEVFGPIYIGDNTFIGINTIILPGVRIGNNCVIGAGSVVTKDVPSNTVYAGVPAKMICSIEEYREKVNSKATFVRSLPAEEKRSFLIKKFIVKE